MVSEKMDDRDMLTAVREMTVNSLMKLGIEWESKPYEEIDIGSQWNRLNGKGFVRCLSSNLLYSIVEMIMHPETMYDFHVHPDADEEIYVVDGNVELTVIKKESVLNDGDVAKVKSGLLHKMYYPNGAHIIVVYRKVNKEDEIGKRAEVIETLLKMNAEKEGEE